MHNKLLQNLGAKNNNHFFLTNNVTGHTFGWVQLGSSNDLGDIVADLGRGCLAYLYLLADRWLGLFGSSPHNLPSSS